MDTGDMREGRSRPWCDVAADVVIARYGGKANALRALKLATPESWGATPAELDRIFEIVAQR